MALSHVANIVRGGVVVVVGVVVGVVVAGVVVVTVLGGQGHVEKSGWMGPLHGTKVVLLIFVSRKRKCGIEKMIILSYF